jgi:hypothetical protein
MFARVSFDHGLHRLWFTDLNWECGGAVALFFMLMRGQKISQFPEGKIDAVVV